MKRRPVVAVALLLVLVAGTGALITVLRHGPAAAASAPDGRAPAGARVRVEVLNGTTTRGLARRATELLRDRGFDVLATGTSAAHADTTIVTDLTGHPDWARRVAAMFGAARIVSRPDSSRDLDVSVVIGASWRPPAKPFYP